MESSDYIFQIVDVASSDISIGKKVMIPSDDKYEDPYEMTKYYKRYQIRLYGVQKDGKNICVKFNDFKPYFYIQLPRLLTKKDIHNFKKSIKDPLRQYLADDYRKKIKRKRTTEPDLMVWKQNADKLIEEIVGCQLMMKKKFYNFTNNKEFPFLAIQFHSINAFYTFRRFFEHCKTLAKFEPFKKGKRYPLNLYESNLEPLLRFFHIRDINPCGWVKINKTKAEKCLDDSETTCPIELKVNSYKNINSHAVSSIAPMLVASFDIECSSGDGSFPDPNNPNDKVIQIGTTFHRYGETECSFNHMVTLGKCDPIAHAEVEEAKDEAELILKWCKMMRRMKPNIITGYNIWGFDWLFLYKKAETLGKKVVKYFNEKERYSRGRQVEL